MNQYCPTLSWPERMLQKKSGSSDFFDSLSQKRSCVILSVCGVLYRQRQSVVPASPPVALVVSPVIALAVANHEKIHKRLHLARHEALVGMHGVERRPIDRSLSALRADMKAFISTDILPITQRVLGRRVARSQAMAPVPLYAVWNPLPRSKRVGRYGSIGRMRLSP